MPERNAPPEIRREVQELSLLFEISQVLDRSLDLRESVHPVLKAMADHMGMLRGTLTLLNRETGEISIEAAYGLSPSQKERGRYRLGEGVTGKVVQTGEPAVVPRISEEPLFLDRTGARKGLQEGGHLLHLRADQARQRGHRRALADRLFAEDVDLSEDVRLLSIIASMIAQAVRLRQAAQEERQRLVEENLRLQEELQDRFRPSNIIGNSKPMQAVYDLIAQVSKSDATVLIRGESGTGKELVATRSTTTAAAPPSPSSRSTARRCPRRSSRASCSATRRARSPARSRSARAASSWRTGGTIFLDEIGDLSPTTQIKLLRVLQEREFERVGGNETIRVDVRIIAATNRDLEALSVDGRFRQDLYYRLNVFPIHLPPLRERKADILLLADHFVEKYAKATHKTVRRISTPAIDMLMSYHWPGNVRELENCIERAVLLADDEVIHGHHLPPTLQTAEATGTVHHGTLQETLDTLERDLIIDALKTSRGNMAKAARALGITERLVGPAHRPARHRLAPLPPRTALSSGLPRSPLPLKRAPGSEHEPIPFEMRRW